VLYVKFDKLIDLLIKNQTNSIIEKSQNDALKSEILERDIKRMKPLGIESDINDLEKNLCNQEFELACKLVVCIFSIFRKYVLIIMLIFIK